MSKSVGGVLKSLATKPLAVFAVLVVAAAVAVPLFLASGSAQGTGSPTTEVKRGALTISISEAGSLQSRDRIVIKSQVEGRTTILSLVPEGTHVKTGDLLVELDSSSLEEQKVSQEITVQNAEASLVRAQETFAVTESQAQSDISKATLDHEFAQQDLKKYTAEDGEYHEQKKQAEASLTLASEDLKRASDEYDWSKKLKEQGYITDTELEADRLAMKRSQINLEQAETALNILETYTYPRQLKQLTSDVEQAKMALDRVQRSARADIVQAQADLKAKQAEFERQKAKLAKLNDQIAKCRITSPVDGMVVYATTGRGGFRGNQEPLAEGQEVRERQELVYLPTATAMIAEIKVQESSLRKVAVGMPVKVTVDAVPGRIIYGTVSKIGLLPDAQSAWLNPDLTVYTTDIELQGNTSDLRPGMTCRAEIIVDRYDDAVYVPVQAVTRVGGKPTVYVQDGKTAQPRTVEVGLDNNRVIRVIGGLEAGEKVLLNPPLEPASVVTGGAGGHDELAGMPDALKESIGRATPPLDGASAGSGAPGAATAAEGQAGDQKQDGLPDVQSMTPEQRREAFRNMTDEERAAMRARFGRERRGTRGAGSTDGAGGAGDSARTGGSERTSADRRSGTPRRGSSAASGDTRAAPASGAGSTGGASRPAAPEDTSGD